jgi:hypothetical protein
MGEISELRRIYDDLAKKDFSKLRKLFGYELFDGEITKESIDELAEGDLPISPQEAIIAYIILRKFGPANYRLTPNQQFTDQVALGIYIKQMFDPEFEPSGSDIRDAGDAIVSAKLVIAESDYLEQLIYLEAEKC